VLVRQDRLPKLRISQLSHMGVLYSPAHPLYGAEGSLRFCWNVQDEHATQACEQDFAAADLVLSPEQVATLDGIAGTTPEPKENGIWPLWNVSMSRTAALKAKVLQ
jgi:hypothetical protein